MHSDDGSLDDLQRKRTRSSEYEDKVLSVSDLEAFARSESNSSDAAMFLDKARRGFIQKLQLPEDIAIDFSALFDQVKSLFSLDPIVRQCLVKEDAILQMDQKMCINFPLSEINARDSTTTSNRCYQHNITISKSMLDGFSALLRQSSDCLDSRNEERNEHSLSKLMEPFDDQSLYSFYHYLDGSSVESHVDRGLLTVVYSPGTSSLQDESGSHIELSRDEVAVFIGNALVQATTPSGTTPFGSPDSSAHSSSNFIPFTSCNHIVSAVHGSRDSLVFRQRGCGAAFLDPSMFLGMPTAYDKQNGQDKELQTVAQYYAAFEATHTSVNALGPASTSVPNFASASTSASSSLIPISSNLEEETPPAKKIKEDPELPLRVKMHELGLTTLHPHSGKWVDMPLTKKQLTDLAEKLLISAKHKRDTNKSFKYENKDVMVAYLLKNIQNIQAVTTTESTIDICLKNQNGFETHFRVARSTRLCKVFDAYAQRIGKDVSTIRFLMNGSYIHFSSDVTPKMLEMENGDQIDVMLPQLGD